MPEPPRDPAPEPAHDPLPAPPRDPPAGPLLAGSVDDPPAAPAGRLLALLVGIDAYTAVPPLSGCTNDVDAIEGLVRDRRPGSVVRRLVNGAATYRAVVDGWRWLAADAGAGDVALFYWSGHGSQEPAPPELRWLEPDLLDETLVCVDSRLGNVFDLADKELNQLIGAVAATGASVVCVFDCCNSGGASRGASSGVGGAVAAGASATLGVRTAPPDPRPRPLTAYLPEVQALAAGALRGGGVASRDATTLPPAEPGPGRARHVALAACQPHQLAREVRRDGSPRGAFTVALSAALHGGAAPAGESPVATPAVPSYRALLRAAQVGLWALSPGQDPTYVAPVDGDLDVTFLEPFLAPGLSPVLAPRPPSPASPGGAGGLPGGIDATLLVAHDASGWEITGGATAGLVAGVEVQLWPLDDPSTPAGRMTVTRVGPGRAQLGAATFAPDPSQRYRAQPTRLPRPPLEVVVPAGVAVGSAHVAVVAATSRPQRPRVVVETASDGSWRISQADGAALVERLPGGAATLDRVLDHLGRWYGLAALANPSSPLNGQLQLAWVPAADVSVRDDGSAPAEPDLVGGRVELAVREVGAGVASTPFYLRVVNGSGRRLHAALIDLTPGFAASLDLLPPGPIEPGVTLVNEARAVAFGVAGPPRIFVDRLRLVVSDAPIVGEALVLPSLADIVAAASRGDVRGELAAGAAGERFAPASRDGGPPDWATIAVDVTGRPA